MHKKLRYPTILVRNLGGIGIKHLENDFLDALSKYTGTEQIVIDARNELTPESPGDFIVFEGQFEGSWLCHKIFKNREELLDQETRDLNSHQIMQETCFIYGELSFSKNGTKVTAKVPSTTSPDVIRISTDIEALKHTAPKNQYIICWYYDPEP